MAVRDAMLSIVKHIERVARELNESQADKLIDAIEKTERVFLVGAGRSGLAAKAFAMRLVQLDLPTYVIGETITPAMTSRDLMIAVSGSGTTVSVINAAKAAKEIGAKVLAITSHADSKLGQVADEVIVIKGRTKLDVERDYVKDQIEGHFDLTPLGTLFEDSVLVFFDGVVAKLMLKLKKSEADLKKHHPTIE